MSGQVRVTIDQQIARVRLDRPEKHNALDLALFRGLRAAQRRLRHDRRVRAVVLSGEGVDFCSGLDVHSMLRAGPLAKVGWKLWLGQANLAQRVSTGWSELPVPVIAAVQGRCWGGGLQIALGADLRIARPDASLSIMEGKWGLIPDMGGTQALRALLPRDQVLKLAMTADPVDGRRALELGLVTETADAPGERALELAAALTERSPDALAAVKKLFGRSWRGPAWLTLARETWYQVRIVMGRNQRIAAQRARGEARDYVARRRW